MSDISNKIEAVMLWIIIRWAVGVKRISVKSEILEYSRSYLYTGFNQKFNTFIYSV